MDFSDSSDDESKIKLKSTLESDHSDFGDCDISEPFDPDREDLCIYEEESDDDDQEKPQWKRGEFLPTVHEFNPIKLGLNINIKSDITESDCFKLFVDHKIVTLITEETNRHHIYATKDVEGYDDSTWKDTDPDEIYSFLSVLMLMTPSFHINKMFDPEDCDMPSIKDTMTYDRFESLLNMLHFCDNDKQIQGDRIFKVRALLEHFKKKFSESFYPSQNIHICESLDVFDFKRFRPRDICKTPPRYILNFLLLCDSETGVIVNYELNSALYISAKEDSARFVIPLLQPYFERGHTFFCNMKYTSPKLFKKLHQHKMNVCGMVRKSLKNMPKLKVDVSEQFSTEIMMLRTWQKKKYVNILTTCHASDKCESAQPPQCMIDYFKYESYSGEDYNPDSMISRIHCLLHKTRWYKKVFFNLVDLCLINAHLIYQMKTQTKVTFEKFQSKVVKQLIATHKH